MKFVCIDKDDVEVSAISLVDEPAIEQYFIALSKESEEEELILSLAKADTEQRIVTGPALIPNKFIHRYDSNREKFYIYFTKESVKNISQLYLVESRQKNVNLQHDKNTFTKDVTMVESWIVETPEMDKAKALGFDVPKGTWMISMKIESDEIWDNIIKKGKANGFSIEGKMVKRFAK